MSNIVSLDKGALPPGEPDQEIIEILERYLSEARRGEITAVAIAVARPNEYTATQWCGASGTKFQLGHAISLLNHRYYQAILEQR